MESECMVVPPPPTCQRAARCAPDRHMFLAVISTMEQRRRVLDQDPGIRGQSLSGSVVSKKAAHNGGGDRALPSVSQMGGC